MTEISYNYFKIQIVFIFCFTILTSVSFFAQPTLPSWKKSVTIIKDNDITLVIYFKFDTSACKPQSFESSKYKFKITEKQTYFSADFITFSFDYVNCNSEVIKKTISVPVSNKNVGEEIESQDYTLQMKKLFTVDPKATSYFYDAKKSNTEENYEVNKYPHTPKNILGNNQINLGEKTQLTVDGDDLNQDFKWVWHKDNCDGEKVGEGKEFAPFPKENTTYFVRAESEKLDYKTDCKQITINVNSKSFAADKIEGDSVICAGKTSKLTVIGGKLGKGAKWIWYSSNDYKPTSKVAEGTDCVVSPNKKTKYYVRAEGIDNITSPVSFEINIADNSIKGEKIKVSSDNICAEENAMLLIEGGKLGSSADWVWYQDDQFISNGNPINPYILEGNHLFKVRAEGLCNNTDYCTVQINGLRPSHIYGISDEYIDRKNKKLSVNGKLGEKAQWVWYVKKKKKQGNYKIKGKGSELVVPSNRSRIYKVTAEGGVCDVKSEISSFFTINASESTKLKRKIDIVYYREGYSDARKKNFHLGFSLGGYSQNNTVHWMDNPAKSTFNFTPDSSASFSTTTNGLSYELVLHPFISENHKNQSSNPLSSSISFYTRGGTSNLSNYGGIQNNSNVFSTNLPDTACIISNVAYKTAKYNAIGTEIAFGVRGFRLYYSYENEFNYLNLSSKIQQYEKVGNNLILQPAENFEFIENLSIEKNKYGFRLGRYASRNKLGLCRGILYDFYILSVNSISSSGHLINHYPAYGAGFSLWIQSILKFNTEVISFQNNNVFTTLKLNLNLDLFY